MPLGKGDGTCESAISVENTVGLRAQVLPIGRANSEYHFSIFAERESVILSQISETCDRRFLAEGLIPLPENRTRNVFGLGFNILTLSLQRTPSEARERGRFGRMRCVSKACAQAPRSAGRLCYTSLVRKLVFHFGFWPENSALILQSTTTDFLASTRTFDEPVGKGNATFESAIREDNRLRRRAQVLPFTIVPVGLILKITLDDRFTIEQNL